MENSDDYAKANEEQKTRWQVSYRKGLWDVGTAVPELLGHIMFVAGILAGFLFTILSDLVLTYPDQNHAAFVIVFSCLIISGFSLLICVILGAALQLLLKTLLLDFTEDYLPRYKIRSHADFETFHEKTLTPIAEFARKSIQVVGYAFIVGVFFFIVSMVFIGWFRSFQLVNLACGIVVTLLAITIFATFRTFLALIQSYEEPDKIPETKNNN